MRDIGTHRALADCDVVHRTLHIGPERPPRSTLRDLADAARGDVAAGGRGVAVKVRISTDPADAPDDCREVDL